MAIFIFKALCRIVTIAMLAMYYFKIRFGKKIVMG